MTTADAAGFLYPFLDPAPADDPAALLADLARSAFAKWTESRDLAAVTVAANAVRITDASVVVRAAPQVLLAGNGGSSCDAERMARLLRAALPTGADGNPVRVRSLVADPATLTALANDLGVERIFARQVEAYGRIGDVLIVFSTSGASANLLAACETACRRGLRTIALAGYSGGPMAEHPAVECCLRVDSASVHRIQEAQAKLVDVLVAAVSGNTVAAR